MNKPTTQYIPIKQLKLLENNPRKISQENFEKLCNSIKENPDYFWARPILANNTSGENVVYAGNQRLKAANFIGLKEVPVIIETLTEEQEKERTVRDNVEFGDWDFDILQADWDIKALEDWGVQMPDIDILPDDANLGDEEHVPETKEEPKTVLGDVYELGGHRLVCGDATIQNDVEKLMNGKLADMVFTDPPYGMKKENDGVMNDNLNYDDLLEFNKDWIPLTFTHLSSVGSWYCWGIDEPLMDIYSNIIKPMIKEQKATFRNLLTWDKGSGQGQNSDNTRSYARADEKCLFVMAGVQGFNNNSDNYYEGWEEIRQYLVQEKEKTGLSNKELTELLNSSHSHYWSKSQWAFPTKEHYKKLQEYGAFKKEYDVLKKEYDVLKKEYYSTRAYFNNTHDNMNNVWSFTRTGNDERKNTGGHATPKPIDLCSRAIKSSCKEGSVVLDVFGGSGSTIVACEKCKRNCYMMELSPRYCDVIVKRWCEYTGKKEFTLNGKPTNIDEWKK